MGDGATPLQKHWPEPSRVRSMRNAFLGFLAVAIGRILQVILSVHRAEKESKRSLLLVH